MSKLNPSGVFRGVHDIRVEDMQAPGISDDSIIIKVDMTGICGTDLHIYHEGLVPVGSVLGHEFSGEIVETGKAVKDLKTGERVVVNPMNNGVGLGLSPGGFANYVKIANAVRNVNVFPIGSGVSKVHGALVEPLSVGLAAINMSNISPEDNVLVTGCGTIGLVTIAGLKGKGVKNIIASDISPKRLELAAKMGASIVFNPAEKGDLQAVITENFGTVRSLNYQPDLPKLTAAFECSGVGAVLKQSMELLAPDGKLTVLAIYGKEFTADPNHIVYKRLRIRGSLFYAPSDFLEAISLIESGKVDLAPIVSHQFPLAELPRAFEVQADSSQSVKVIVDCS